MRTLPDATEPTPLFAAYSDGLYTFCFETDAELPVVIKRGSEVLHVVYAPRSSVTLPLAANDELTYQRGPFTVYCNRLGDEFPPEE
jgi:hypothetical protein